MPVTMLNIGETGEIKRIGGNEETRRVLNNLGFVVGAEVVVVSAIGGNVIVNIKDSRVAINEDMAKRWREVGDEAKTDVPRLGTDNNSFQRYRGADIHVQKGDHIRLKEISLTYELPSKWVNKIMLGSANIGFTATNLGLIWKKNNVGIDPDFIPNTRDLRMAPTPSYNFSLNLNF